VRVDPSLLLGGRLTPLVALKDCRVFLDFSNKRAFFRQQLKAFHGPKSQFGSLPLMLSRKTLVEDTFRELNPFANYMKSHDIRGRPDITFRGEEGIDAGGLTREWYEILCREMFNPNYSLFVASGGEGGTTFQPNPLSEAVYGLDGPLGARAWFQFVGRILGKAVADGCLIDAHFTRSFYKHMLGMAVTFQDDMQPHDPADEADGRAQQVRRRDARRVGRRRLEREAARARLERAHAHRLEHLVVLLVVAAAHVRHGPVEVLLQRHVRLEGDLELQRGPEGRRVVEHPDVVHRHGRHGARRRALARAECPAPARPAVDNVRRCSS
jgi:hypothetical protein